MNLERDFRLANSEKSSDVWQMEASEEIQCPFCGQMFEIEVDTTVASQRFVTDCEICCRPLEVSAECEAGEVVSVQVQGA